MAYTSESARIQLLDQLADAMDHLAVALASLSEAYELVDDRTAEAARAAAVPPSPDCVRTGAPHAFGVRWRVVSFRPGRSRRDHRAPTTPIPGSIWNERSRRSSRQTT